jgi:hypothetical protein
VFSGEHVQRKPDTCVARSAEHYVKKWLFFNHTKISLRRPSHSCETRRGQGLFKRNGFPRATRLGVATPIYPYTLQYPSQIANL